MVAATVAYTTLSRDVCANPRMPRSGRAHAAQVFAPEELLIFYFIAITRLVIFWVLEIWLSIILEDFGRAAKWRHLVVERPYFQWSILV